MLLSLSVSLIYLVVLASLHLPGLKNILGYASSITVAEVLTSTNEQRTQRGVGQLSLNPQLSQAALAKAQDMLARQYWAHNTPEGKEPWSFIDSAGYRYQIAGENLARNFSHTSDMVQAWLNSPSHRSNLLSERYTETGIAVLQGEMDGIPTTLVVQMFGAPQQAIADITVSAKTEEREPPSPEEPLAVTNETTAQIDPTAPLPRQPLPAEETALLGTESQLQAALISSQNELAETRQPLFSPLFVYRLGMLTMSSVLIVLFVLDSRLAHKQKRSKHTGKHLAHVLLLIAVLLTLSFTKTGSLF